MLLTDDPTTEASGNTLASHAPGAPVTGAVTGVPPPCPSSLWCATFRALRCELNGMDDPQEIRPPIEKQTDRETDTPAYISSIGTDVDGSAIVDAGDPLDDHLLHCLRAWLGIAVKPTAMGIFSP